MARAAPVSLIAEHVVDGRYLEPTDEDSILIGKGLADALLLNVGDRITMVGSDVHKQNRQRTINECAIDQFVNVPKSIAQDSYN